MNNSSHQLVADPPGLGVNIADDISRVAFFPLTFTWEEPGDGEQEDDSANDLSLEEIFDLVGYEEPPILLINTDPEAALARQKEMMEATYGSVGQEDDPAKRMGLAMQQLDLEQRHSMRLLLMFDDPAELTAHLKRCLDDRKFGYGERGNNGRTIAQAMAALGDLEEVARQWLVLHAEFQGRVLNGRPISFRSTFDDIKLITFTPVLQRIAPTKWQLGVEDEGKCRVFNGSLAEIWDDLCDTYVEWCEADEGYLVDRQDCEQSIICN